MITNLGSPSPFDVTSFIRRFIPFTSSPFRSGQKDGARGQLLSAVFANSNTDTTFTISLGHIPENYIQLQSTVGGIVYNGANQGTDWTPNKIILRATAIGTYRLRIG